MKPSLSPQHDVASERRSSILDAAERCFVLQGFHRTTMQDVARAARMSVGNLYRYFPAKDAMVLALAERDREEAAHAFLAEGPPRWPTLARLIRHHLVEAPRDKAVLLVEVWAEGSRNPTVAAVLARFEAENQACITAVLRDTYGLLLAEAADLADRVRIEAQGIQVARALSADYDAAAAVDRLLEEVGTRIAASGGRCAAPLHHLEALA